MVMDAVMPLFSDRQSGTEPNSGTKKVFVIRTIVSRSAAKAFQSSALHTAVEMAVRKCFTELIFVKKVGRHTIDGPDFTVQVLKFVKHEVEKRSLEEAEMEQKYNI